MTVAAGVAPRPGVVRLLLRVLVCAGLVAGWALAPAPPAWAHASFVTAQPAAGTNLAAAPGVVTLRFSEPLVAELSRVTVTDPDGRQYSGGPTAEQTISVDVESTALGRYDVEWQTVSPVDGHTLRGSFAFGVGAEVAEHEESVEAPTGSGMVVAGARTVEYVGLLGTLGLMSLSFLAAVAGLRWRPAGLGRWVAVAALGGLVTVAGEALVATAGSPPSAIGTYLLAPAGWPRLLRLATEMAAAAMALWAGRSSGPTGRRAARVAATLLTLVSLAALSAGGHAAAGGTAAVAIGVLHLWSAGVWAGTIIVMAFHRPPGGWGGQDGRALVGEFSLIALTSFMLTVVTGTARTWQELAQVSDLWTTAYGSVLAVKLAAVLAMLPLSVLAWRRLRDHTRTEAAAALVVLLATATLAAFPVPPGRAGDKVAQQAEQDTDGLPRPGDLTLAHSAGATVVGLTLRPVEPGVNDLYVHLVPPDGADEAGDLVAELTAPTATAAEMRTCGTACRVATLRLDGGETLHVDVSGSDGGRASFTLPELPAPDGTDLADALTERMQQVRTLRYDEVFRPVDPPITSTWEIVAPSRLRGAITAGTDRRGTIRIGDRRWSRDGPDGDWTGGEPGGVAVKANRFIWDYDDKVAARILGEETIDGVDTRIVTFFVDVGLPVWYRLWVDDDERVRRAQMRAQGHFMDHQYYDFDAPITIEPPIE